MRGIFPSVQAGSQEIRRTTLSPNYSGALLHDEGQNDVAYVGYSQTVLVGMHQRQAVDKARTVPTNFSTELPCLAELP